MYSYLQNPISYLKALRRPLSFHFRYYNAIATLDNKISVPHHASDVRLDKVTQFLGLGFRLGFMWTFFKFVKQIFSKEIFSKEIVKKSSSSTEFFLKEIERHLFHINRH
jgi:hypothetical protein